MESEGIKNSEKLKKLGLNNPGFKTPENYFEEFSDALFSKMTEDELPNKTGFKTPPNYFEKFEEELISKLEKTTPKRKSKVRLLYTVISVAAALFIYFGISQYNQQKLVTFDSITVTDIQAYIEAGNMYVDSYTLASIDGNLDVNSFFDDAISNQEIDNYLNTLDPEFLFIDN
ncbi:hypothetical protein [Flavicella sp.]|uniref:hypothetical protein n=1 Tax=Flavicella sp. TaxID=2957742 RepID=UPI00301AD199